ncbi:MAG TPA: beta-N-acetylhexosaminidase [Candidatus Limnocylindrales bacterium]
MVTAGSSPSVTAAIVGVAGCTLAEDERRLIQGGNPCGFILFARNCASPAQVRSLVEDLRAAVGRPDAPVLIDQEGGRVARLCPPHWPARPPARRLGLLAERDPQAGIEAAWLHARLIAADLVPLGISVVCAPVLDLALPGRTRAIGDRALAADPQLVAVLGQAMIEGFLEGGVLPVIKHLPGHGRARRDSHLGLPTVSASVERMAGADWIPFRACRAAPLAMTAHVLYPALDAVHPATMSPSIIETVIRGAIGVAGALLSDDLSMRALSGSLGARSAAARAAGCDIALHCNGDLAEMAEVLDAVGPLQDASARRARDALGRLRAPAAFDVAAGAARFAALLAAVEPALEA